MAATRSLIDDIYSAVAEPARWSRVLVDVSDHVGALGGMAAYINLRRGENMMVIGRLSPVFAGVYEREYLANPWNKALERVATSRQVVMMSSLIPFSSVSKTAFHDQVLKPGDIVDGMNVLLPSLAVDGGFGGFHFSLSRPQEKRKEEGAERLQELAPHLCRALETSIKLAPQMDGGRQLERVLSLMPTAALLIDGKLRVRYANDAAEALFRERDGLSLDRDGRLQPGDVLPGEAAPFARAMTDAIRVASGRGDRIGDPVRITRASGAGPLLVIPIPLPPPAFELWRLSDPARAMVLIIDPNARGKGLMAGLQRAFGLTPAEARVATLVASGLSGPKTADALGITPATVKTHLGRCFDKTGVHSQVGLARMLAAWPTAD